MIWWIKLMIFNLLVELALMSIAHWVGKEILVFLLSLFLVLLSCRWVINASLRSPYNMFNILHRIIIISKVKVHTVNLSTFISTVKRQFHYIYKEEHNIFDLEYYFKIIKDLKFYIKCRCQKISSLHDI